MPFPRALVAVALTLAALVSGCSSAADDQERAAATGGPAASSSTSTSASSSSSAPETPLPEVGSFPLAPGWPAEAAELARDSTTWAVFVAVVPAGEDDELSEPFADAVRMGYSPGLGAICASAADGSELRFAGISDPQAVSVYFSEEASARDFARRWATAQGRDVAAVHEVRPACF